MIKFSSFILLTSLCILSACSKNSSNGGGAGNNTPDKKPTNSEEALQKLSAQHRLNFEAWKSNIVKSCNSAQAFGLENDKKIEELGIDGQLFLKKTNGSVLFTDGKSFSIIDDYNSFWREADE